MKEEKEFAQVYQGKNIALISEDTLYILYPTGETKQTSLQELLRIISAPEAYRQLRERYTTQTVLNDNRKVFFFKQRRTSGREEFLRQETGIDVLFHERYDYFFPRRFKELMTSITTSEAIYAITKEISLPAQNYYLLKTFNTDKSLKKITPLFTTIEKPSAPLLETIIKEKFLDLADIRILPLPDTPTTRDVFKKIPYQRLVHDGFSFHFF